MDKNDKENTYKNLDNNTNNKIKIKNVNLSDSKIL